MRVLAPKEQQILLDKKDWRVLQQLVQNVRSPISHIARECLLSRQSVEYRISLLRKNNLLIGSRAVVNIGKLRYHSYHVFLEIHTPKEEQEIITRAKKAPFVNAIVTYSGKYNVEISIMAKNQEEFFVYYQQLIDNLRIRDDQLLILIDTLCAKVLPQKYFPELKSLHPKHYQSSHEKSRKVKGYSIDATDFQILLALSRDATSSNIALARKLEVSKDTVTYRIAKLEKNGYLLGYRPVVNYATLGLTINSLLIKINHTTSTTKKFESYIKNNGSVLWATKTVGYFNYLVYVITKDLEEFHSVINGMKTEFDDIIKTYEILFAFEELKYNFMAESIVRSYSNSKLSKSSKEISSKSLSN